MTIAYVTSHQVSGNGASIPSTFTIAAGQSLVCFAADGGNPSVTLTLTDTLGNTYVKRQTGSDTFNGSTYSLFDCVTPAFTGSSTLTLATSAGAGGGPGLISLVYTGIASFDQVATYKWAHSGWAITTNGAASNSITPGSAPAQLISMGTGQGGTIAPDAGANSRVNNQTWVGAQNTVIEDYALATTAAAQAFYTFSSATASNAILAATYIAAGAAAGPQLEPVQNLGGMIQVMVQ